MHIKTIPFERSFASHEKSQYWNKEKNGDKNPSIICKSTSKKYWFDCSECNHIFESKIIDITRLNNSTWCPFCSNNKLCNDANCKFCFEKSFASHLKSQYWNKEKNGYATPRNIFKGTSKRYWLNCIDCNHVFKGKIFSISHENSWCCFCANRKLCDDETCQLCFEKSFAYYERSKIWSSKNGDVTPRQVFKGTQAKYWFKCHDCNHEFQSMPNDMIRTNNGCPFCTNCKLCTDETCKICFEKSFASHEKSLYWNKEKNVNINPRQIFKGTIKKYWFDCDNCKSTFKSKINHITFSKSWCPYCVNKTESKLYDILVNHFPTIIRQFKQEWCRNLSYLPFDFCILEHKIIIELDGMQHFQQIANWRPPEEQYQIDNYKESCANQNGYSVIRIIQEDVWADKYDWLRELLDSIEQLKSQDEPKNIYLHRNNEYQYY